MSVLPVRVANFTGRDAQLRELLDTLRPDAAGRRQGPVAAVITGLAGVGKTELVLQAAAQAMAAPGWFPGGFVFVDLFGYDRERCLSPDRVLGSWLRALGVADVDVPADPQARAALYRSVLSAYAEHGRRILVIIDNASSADQVAPLLPDDGCNAALITSRHTLNVGARLCDLDVLAPQAAVTLIRGALQHARGPHDTRVDDEPGHAARIAEFCGRLPLALQICAALLADTPTRPLASLAQSLADVHRRLDHLAREDRAVRAAFDLSHQHLERASPSCARLFRLLPLNPGPDIAATGVARLCGTDETTAEIMLQDLARAHLIEPARPWGRWRLHDLLRLYADERGHADADTDQRSAALARLLEYYVQTAAAADTHLVKHPTRSPSPVFRDRAHALSWLDAEHVNLILAAAFATAQGHPAVTAGLATCLAEFCALRGYFDEMTLLAGVALPVCRLAGDREGEGWAQYLLGSSMMLPGRSKEAIEPFREAVALFRESGASQAEAQTLIALSIALTDAGRLGEAEEVHQRALAVYRQTGDRGGEGRAMGIDAVRLGRAGQDDKAMSALCQGLSTCRETGDRFGEGRTLGLLGLEQVRLGRHRQGVESLEQAIMIFREIGNRRVEGEIQCDLGAALVRMGRFAQAVQALEEAAACCQETGHRFHERRVAAALGAALHGLGRYDEATDAFRKAIAADREHDDDKGQAVLLDNLGAALLATKHYEEAARHLRQSIALSQETGDRSGEAESFNRLGLALRMTGPAEDASAAFRQAIAIFDELGDGRREAIVLTNLGSHLLASDRPEQAVPPLRQALTLCQNTGDVPVRSLVTRLLKAARSQTPHRDPGS
ncbi:tetratricopeptide repeat protein [Spirillospora sp. NBC_00431]